MTTRPSRTAMAPRRRARPALWASLAAAPLMLAACNAPDYTPVRDWAATASLAVDEPRMAGGSVAPPPGTGLPASRPAEDGILAMQEALATYLQALATLASDGVLPYRESPFVQLATRAEAASTPGAQAITALGLLLRRATHYNARAPEMRDNIRAADPQVQALVAALREAVARQEAGEAAARREAAAFYAEVEANGRDAAAQQALREWARERDAAFAAEAARRLGYGQVLARVAEGHALLKARASRMTRLDVVQEVRAAEAELRRAAQPLRTGSAG
ncbi:hypothetical protein [Roseococcus pinisoli]|uniref:Lipoprotein n=1 Tax=Roseococcus pinisoli TaxID=2835040 RepID=A0ABS5Q8X6_9PROT|nr:hypothetical protein [Roseococcus pinisoli]MBS7810121.1 hypothetical protein [Roseococcus pinisoli]